MENYFTDIENHDFDVADSEPDAVRPIIDELLAHAENYPLLSKEEELTLGKLIAENGPDSQKAREKLICSNIKLVVYVAKKYRNPSVPLEDRISMGFKGLITAANKYDYTKGFKFSTYAINWIAQAILRDSANEESTIRIPVHAKGEERKIKTIKSEIEIGTGKSTSAEQIAKVAGVPLQKVETVLARPENVISLDAYIGDDESATILDMIAAPSDNSPTAICEKEDCCEQINKLLNTLPERERNIIKCRYGFFTGNPMTLEATAKYLGLSLSRERMRQIESKALEKLRKRSTRNADLYAYAGSF